MKIIRVFFAGMCAACILGYCGYGKSVCAQPEVMEKNAAAADDASLNQIEPGVIDDSEEIFMENAAAFETGQGSLDDGSGIIEDENVTEEYPPLPEENSNPPVK